MKRTATFVSDGKLLTGREAIAAFVNQPHAKCNCGCGADGDRLTGTCSDCPAEWLECSNCDGTAIGRPLVYRTVSQIKARQAELAAK